jgi:hypothetical protein
VNKGNAPITVNGFPLLPQPVATVSGESYGIAGNADEIYKGHIVIDFNLVGAPSNPLCVVVQKYFID